MRKDSLSRHFAKCHPGIKEAFKHKTVGGQKSLSAFFSSKPPGKSVRIDTSTSVKENVTELELSLDEVGDIPEITNIAKEMVDEPACVPGQAVRVRNISTEGYTSSTVEPSKKRQCSGTDGVTADTLSVSSIIKSVKDEFVSEISKMLQNSKINDLDTSKSKEKNENQSLAYFFQRAENLESLKPHLTDNHLTIDVHKNIVVCDICVDDPYSNLGGIMPSRLAFSTLILMHTFPPLS